MAGGSLFVGRWNVHQGKFISSVSTSCTASSSCGSLTSDSTGASTEKADENQWPWMKDIKDRSRTDHPIAHRDAHDRRPPVRALILQHQKDIDRLKRQIQGDPLYNAAKHDDLWLMRFLFSHGMNQTAAFEAAVATLRFRHSHGLDHWDIRHIEVHTQALLESDYPYAPACGKMLHCYDTDDTMLYYVPDVQRGVIGFLHLAGRNQHAMAAELSETDYFEAHLFSTEWKFQWLDYLTRSTGLLTKYLSIADCAGVHRGMMNKESKRRDGDAAKSLENYYPQLLGTMVVVNAPIWINVIFTIIRPFVPKRLLEKINVCKPLKRERDLGILQEYVALEHLPERYGGRLQDWPPAFLPVNEVRCFQ